MLKRLFDIVFSFFGLILVSPFLLIIAVLIKTQSPGPVFYRGERVGKEGKTFRIFKFRTMVVDAEKLGGPSTASDDPRLLKIGNFLKKFQLDEIPQLINVLRGEMSLVGPRPTFRYQVEKYNDFQRKRLLVKPGITGWALIHGRNLLSWEERIKYDVWYVENWSLWLDFKILLKTIKIVLLRKGLYGEEGINDPFV